MSDMLKQSPACRDTGHASRHLQYRKEAEKAAERKSNSKRVKGKGQGKLVGPIGAWGGREGRM